MIIQPRSSIRYFVVVLGIALVSAISVSAQDQSTNASFSPARKKPFQ